MLTLSRYVIPSYHYESCRIPGVEFGRGGGRVSSREGTNTAPSTFDGRAKLGILCNWLVVLETESPKHSWSGWFFNLHFSSHCVKPQVADGILQQESSTCSLALSFTLHPERGQSVSKPSHFFGCLYIDSRLSDSNTITSTLLRHSRTEREQSFPRLLLSCRTRAAQVARAKQGSSSSSFVPFAPGLDSRPYLFFLTESATIFIQYHHTSSFAFSQNKTTLAGLYLGAHISLSSAAILVKPFTGNHTAIAELY